MSDADDNFEEAFKGFGDDPAQVTPTPEPATPPVPPSPAVEPVKKPEEEKDDTKGDEKDPPVVVAEKPVEPVEPKEEKPAETVVAENSQQLTKDDVQEVVSNLLNSERNSTKELDTTTKEVLDIYYPDGLSNTLIDEQSGKELRTPKDVVDASGGEMSIEEAASWLMNEQFKLDKSVSEIKDSARQIAETTIAFKRDSIAALQKYEPLFKWQPTLQKKAYDLVMKQVKIDKEKNVILSAPDVLDLYDTYLEPYQQAYEFNTKQPATNPTDPPSPPVKPSAEDRMDENGDAGITPPNDPNDFAQQVRKELAKEI